MRPDPNNKSAENSRPTSARRQAAGIVPPAPRFARRRQLARDGKTSTKSAKRLLEEAFEQLSSPQKSMLAHQLGYDSFAGVLAASTVVTLSDGSAWWLTADRNGSWTAWNLCSIGFSQGCQTSDGDFEAERNVCGP
jgi:hypothetical protein